MIKFRCPSCSQKLGVPDEYAGKRVRCTRCKEATQVPQPELPVLEEIAVAPALETGEDVGGDVSADEAFSDGMWDDFGGEEGVDSAAAVRQEAIAQAGPPKKEIKTSHIGPQRGGKSRASGGGGGSALSKLKTPLLIVVGLVVVIGILIAVVGKGGGGAEDNGRGEQAVRFTENFLRTARQLDPDQLASMLWLAGNEFGDEFGDESGDGFGDKFVEYLEENALRRQKEINELLNALDQGNIRKIDSSIEYSRFEKGTSGFLIQCQIEYDASYRVAEVGVVEWRGEYNLAGIVASDSAGILASVGGPDSDRVIEKVNILVDDFGFPQGLMLIVGTIIAVVLLYVVSLWMLFCKAGEPGWASIVPVYNLVVLARVGDKPEWMGLVASLVGGVPVVGGIISAVLLFVIWIGVAETYGKGFLFGIGLALLPFIFCPILAFSSERVA